MPKMNGIETVKHIQNMVNENKIEGESLNVIFISANIDQKESLVDIPSLYKEKDDKNLTLTKLREIKEKVSTSGRNAFLVENCGMENERIFYDLKSIPDEAGYFSVLIVK